MEHMGWTEPRSAIVTDVDFPRQATALMKPNRKRSMARKAFKQRSTGIGFAICETRITMTPGNRPMDLRVATRDLRGVIDKGKVTSSFSSLSG